MKKFQLFMFVFIISIFFQSDVLASIKVIVIGPEHSGTRWVSGLLSIHPEIEFFKHLSYPSGGEWPKIDQIYINEKLKGTNLKIIICVRDKTCNNLSAEKSSSYKNNKKVIAQDYGNLVDDAISIINKQIQAIDKSDLVFISYESLLLHRKLVLQQTFRLLGINEDNYDYDNTDVITVKNWIHVSLKGIDGNAKYYNR